MAREDEIGLSSLVIPEAEAVVLTAGKDHGRVSVELGRSDAHAVADELLGNRDTVEGLAVFRQLSVLRAKQEAVLFTRDVLEALCEVNDVRRPSLLALVLFIGCSEACFDRFPQVLPLLDDAWQRLVVEAPFLPLSRVNEDFALNRTRDNEAIVAEKVRAHQAVLRVRVLPERLLGVAHVPDVQEAIGACGDDLLTVGRPICLVALKGSEYMRTYEQVVTLERRSRLSGLAVPDAGRRVGRGRHQHGSLRVVGEGPDSLLVAAQSHLAPNRSRVPQHDRAIVRA